MSTYTLKKVYYVNLYILREFKKLVISFFTFKNTSNLGIVWIEGGGRGSEEE